MKWVSDEGFIITKNWANTQINKDGSVGLYDLWLFRDKDGEKLGNCLEHIYYNTTMQKEIQAGPYSGPLQLMKDMADHELLTEQA